MRRERDEGQRRGDLSEGMPEGQQQQQEEEEERLC